jgi:hypothetical protein
MSWILLSSRGLELDQRFSGHPSAMFHFDALRLGPPADCRAVCPVAGVLRAPGLVARHRLGPSCRASVSRSARGMPGVQSDVLLGALQPGADGIVTFSVAAEERSRGSAGGQDGVSDSDPRTLAEYVRHCPKIVVR